MVVVRYAGSRRSWLLLSVVLVECRHYWMEDLEAGYSCKPRVVLVVILSAVYERGAVAVVQAVC